MRFLAAAVLCVAPALLSAQVIDNFDAKVDWQARPSDGVSLVITQDPAGHSLAAMRLDFDFHGHAGYAIAHKPVSIDLPPDYEFSFWIRGNAQPISSLIRSALVSPISVPWLRRT